VSDEEPERDVGGQILSAHLGASANCSSIGSYVDYLFLSASASGALLAALSVALARPVPPGDPAPPVAPEARSSGDEPDDG
jgi:hypothetical protein